MNSSFHELGDGLYAYEQPDGGWGWSNAGLITGDGTSLLVDTLFDLQRTRALLDTIKPITDRHPIEQAMNTHGNGDHWFGNELLPDGIPIVATAAALEEMEAVGPQLVHAAVQSARPRARSSTRSRNGRCGASTSRASRLACRPRRSPAAVSCASATAPSS